MGLGLLAVSASKLCHCWGSPVNFCSRWSKPVWTRCSKLEGPEISSLFFFFPNMVERSGEVRGKQERKEKKAHVYTLLYPQPFSLLHRELQMSLSKYLYELHILRSMQSKHLSDPLN